MVSSVQCSRKGHGSVSFRTGTGLGGDGADAEVRGRGASR